jgi:hypothetical protein
MLFEANDESSTHRISDLARALEDECRRKNDDVVVKGLIECATFLLPGLSVYGVIAGLLNVRMPSVGAQLAEQVVNGVAKYLRAGNWNNAAALFRFLNELCLSRVAQEDSMVGIYSQLLAEPCDSGVRFFLFFLFIYLFFFF